MTRFALAIEISNPSSGPPGRVDLRGGGQVLAGPGVALALIGQPQDHDTELLHEQTRHDDDLMPAIDRLCRRRGVRPADLGRVAVSIGPGGYTSLRIAVATAKMLSEATGAATVPVPSAAVAAWCLTDLPEPVLICLASKGDTAFGVLRAGAGQAPGLLDAAALLSLRPATVIADRFLPEPMRAAAAEVGARLVEPIFAASALLQIAERTPPVDPLALAPLYPRQAEAVTQWRKRHGG